MRHGRGPGATDDGCGEQSGREEEQRHPERGQRLVRLVPDRRGQLVLEQEQSGMVERDEKDGEPYPDVTAHSLGLPVPGSTCPTVSVL